jgi:hypothetical protein
MFDHLLQCVMFNNIRRVRFMKVDHVLLRIDKLSAGTRVRQFIVPKMA